MNIEWYMAARARIVYHGKTTLCGALFDKADNDGAVVAAEETYALHYDSVAMSPLDAIEYQIATLVDNGSALPVSNEEAYGAARWIGQSGLEALPDPMPRAFVLYIAKALVDDGKYETMSAALDAVLTTKTFA